MKKIFSNKIFILSLILFIGFAVFCPDICLAADDACNIDEFKERYTCSCFSCPTVNVIITTFFEVGKDAFGLTKRAANEILGIMSILWIAFFLLQKLSSFTPIELPELAQSFGVMMFKIVVAAACINIGGIEFLTNFVINPIISFASDFGLGLLNSSGTMDEQAMILQNIFTAEVLYA